MFIAYCELRFRIFQPLELNLHFNLFERSFFVVVVAIIATAVCSFCKKCSSCTIDVYFITT